MTAGPGPGPAPRRVTVRDVVDAGFELCVDRYAAGETVADLARAHRIPRSTLVDWLTNAGVYEPGRRSGVAAVKTCRRGHDMAVYGVQKYTATGAKNGRMCVECKRIAQRKTV